MKTTFILVLVTLGLFFSSCKKEDDPDDNSAETQDCMDYVSINDLVQHASDIFFINDLEGWIMSGENLLHTSDGGQVWSVMNDFNDQGVNLYANGSIYKLHFIDSDNGYLSLDWGMDGYEVEEQYYYTTDKGATWSPITLPTTPEETINNYGIGVNSTQMVFLSYTQYDGEDYGHKRLYFVSNTSHAITNEVILPDSYNWNAHDIHFTDAGVINMAVTDDSQNYMAHSEDFGNSWTYTEIEYYARVYSLMEFPTDNVGYLPADPGILLDAQPFYKTTDGGATWTEKTISVERGTTYHHFSFSDENNGLAIRYLGDGLYKTTDGGDSWERVGCFTDSNYDLDIWTSTIGIAYPSTDNAIVLTNWTDTEAEGYSVTNRIYFYKGE